MINMEHWTLTELTYLAVRLNYGKQEADERCERVEEPSFLDGFRLEQSFDVTESLTTVNTKNFQGHTASLEHPSLHSAHSRNTLIPVRIVINRFVVKDSPMWSGFKIQRDEGRDADNWMGGVDDAKEESCFWVDESTKINIPEITTSIRLNNGTSVIITERSHNK